MTEVAMGLDFVEFIMSVEAHFRITISDEQAEQLKTGEDTVACVVQRVQENLGARRPVNPKCLREGRPSPELIWAAVRRLLAEQTGMAESEITRDSGFIKDLGFG